jgi:riboflavin synthase
VQTVDAEAGGMLGARIPAALQKYCVEKGSIALDGVSLTIASLRGDTVQIAVIPHTAAATTLAEKRVSDPLHVEVDVLAKYVESLLAARFPQQ